jgi:hypothetical protein
MTAANVRCEHCGLALRLVPLAQEWEADRTGLRTCFDNPGSYRRHAPNIGSQSHPGAADVTHPPGVA